MVTGDDLQTMKSISMECGILALDGDTSERNVIEGMAFRQLSEKEREVVATKNIGNLVTLKFLFHM